MVFFIKQGSGSSTSISIPGLVGLANGGTAVSASIDNTAGVVPAVSAKFFMNAAIKFKFTTTSPTNNNGTVTLILLKSNDGIVFEDATDEHQILGTFIANSDNTTYTVSTTTAGGGSLPEFWKLAVKNDSGAAFNATSGNFDLRYVGKYIYTDY